MADGGILEVFYFEYKALFGCSMSSFEFKNDYNHYTVDFLTPLCPREVALGKKLLFCLLMIVEFEVKIEMFMIWLEKGDTQGERRKLGCPERTYC